VPSRTPSDVERLLSGLLDPVRPEHLEQLIGREQRLLALLDPATRERVADILRDSGWRLRVLSVGVAAAQIRRLRPDLTAALETPPGRRWLALEIVALKELAREVA